MTTLLTIPATPDAPVACDLTGAEDTLPDRAAELRRLLDEALVERTSTGTEVVLRFAEHPETVDRVLDLARRESACCPFLAYDVRLAGGQVVWTITGRSASELSVLADVLAV
jgi:hypothetical protein